MSLKGAVLSSTFSGLLYKPESPILNLFEVPHTMTILNIMSDVQNSLLLFMDAKMGVSLFNDSYRFARFCSQVVVL